MLLPLLEWSLGIELGELVQIACQETGKLSLDFGESLLPAYASEADW